MNEHVLWSSKYCDESRQKKWGFKDLIYFLGCNPANIKYTLLVACISKIIFFLLSSVPSSLLHWSNTQRIFNITSTNFHLHPSDHEMRWVIHHIRITNSSNMLCTSRFAIDHEFQQRKSVVWFIALENITLSGSYTLHRNLNSLYVILPVCLILFYSKDPLNNDII